MSLKNDVLEQLEANRPVSVSGEYLAGKLNVSRSAIWKTINSLKKEGYQIDAVTNKGYSLSPGSDLLSREGILPHLKPKHKGIDLMILKTADSTNLTAKRLAVDGAAHGTAVMSEEQTAGKGRFGRSFFSPPHTGIYMSVVLRLNLPASDSVLVTTAAALAVCRAVRSLTGIEPKIKWVNDILLNGKKICGILTEAITDFESGSISGIVVGIGLNFSTADFGGKLQQIACSLFPGQNPSVTRNELAAEILNQLFDICADFGNENHLQEYRALSCVLGEDIYFIKNDTRYAGKAVDIDSKGRLVVVTDNGSAETLSSGEISIRLGKNKKAETNGI